MLVETPEPCVLLAIGQGDVLKDTAMAWRCNFDWPSSHASTSCHRQEGASFGVIRAEAEDFREFGGRLS
jgi:hypothetical protein